jgi:amino acid adenylation domain-containing protein
MISTLNALLRRAARGGGDRVAVSDAERSLTYAELDRQSDQLARLLQSLGVAPGDRVGLYLEKSVESVVGLYGAMKAGAAYVPLDPAAPVRRLAYIAGNCGIRVLLTGAEKADSWVQLLEAGAPLQSLVVMNAEAAQVEGRGADASIHGADAILRQDAAPLADPAISLDLAYILYTSGSTGDPKGVMLTHRNALTFVEWGVEAFGVTQDDRLSGHAPLHFDLSVFDLFAAAWAGASLTLVPAKLSVFPLEVARFMRDNRITVWYSVPSILSMLALRGGLSPGDLPDLRVVLFAGEVFPTPYLRRLMELLPGTRFANLYGPTETNVCTWYEVGALGEDDARSIPIGRAIADVEVFAVTEEGARARPGEVGELLVRGSTVMRGYWGDPERTARGLVPHPFQAEPKDPAYRTGDLAVQDEDGDWRYLGRRDGQIKSRGYRIELGEIEATLYAHAAVTECAAVAIPDDLVTNRIKVYVVSRDTDERALANFCAERLPRYMVPELWEFREALPRTSTGKIDRRSLSDAAR